MTNTTLLPCPFCGAPGELIHNSNLDYFVRCTDKRCAARTRQHHENENGAVLGWNKRAATTIGKVQVEIEPALRGMLTAEQVREAIFNDSSYASYDGAKYYADGINMQAIADELNRRVGRTCHIEERKGDWYCSACGGIVGTCDCTSELYIDGNALDLWEFCPRCGARVVSE
jgi:ssDNA-binding Zn-finger/Zn-ribbon topoisomerase 1